MDVLRIVLTQNSASYKKEETVTNKMTYPLPPFSTVIGALHSACNYKTYHPMDISIQGNYESMHKKAYTDYCFLNSVMDDRGMLVKMDNSNLLSRAFDKIATPKKSQGSSFRKGTTIQVFNDELLKEYRDLKDLADQISEFKKERFNPLLKVIGARKRVLASKKKDYPKDSLRYKQIVVRDLEIKEMEKILKSKMKSYEEDNLITPYSRFASLTTSLKYYEVLNNIELVIHVRTDGNTLKDIESNIYNLKSIGRSEDFVEIKEIKRVKLEEKINDELFSDYSAYIDYDLIKNKKILSRTANGRQVSGTKYYINKNYVINDGKREFEKKKVLYLSKYSADDESFGDNIFFDLEDQTKYIVNFN